MSLLAEDGPSVALDQAVRALGEHPFHRAALAWVRGRLSEQGYPDDGWRDGVWRCDTDPYVRLTAMLEAEVGAPMATAGFTRSGTPYRLLSDVGDYAIVDFRPLSGPAGPAVRFRVTSAVLPGPELDWRQAQVQAHPERASGAIQVGAHTGWLQTWHRPPAAHVVTGGPLPSLNAGLWTFTPDTASACGAALVELLTAEATPRPGALQFGRHAAK